MPGPCGRRRSRREDPQPEAGEGTISPAAWDDQNRTLYSAGDTVTIAKQRVRRINQRSKPEHRPRSSGEIVSPTAM